MINWKVVVASVLSWSLIVGLISYRYVKQKNADILIEYNSTQVDSLVNVISVKDGQIIQLEQEYSDLEQLKTRTRTKYRDRIIKVRDGDVIVVFEDLRDNL